MSDDRTQNWNDDNTKFKLTNEKVKTEMKSNESRNKNKCTLFLNLL